MHDKLDADRNDKTPVEDRRRWLLPVKLLKGRVKTEHHEDNGDAETKVSGLVVTHFDTV